MNHHFFVRDGDISTCKCGVTREMVRGRYEFTSPVTKKTTLKAPVCVGQIEAVEPKKPKDKPAKVIAPVIAEAEWSEHEGRKIECIAFISSLYDDLFRGKNFSMTSPNWNLKNRAETILESNGVKLTQGCI